MGISYNPSVVTDSLVLCLDAGNTKSYPGTGTTWTDLSPSGINGTLTNGPTYSGSNGGGIVFDGTNDYCDLGSASALNRSDMNITVEAAFYYSGTSQSSVVFTHRLNASNYEQISMGFGGPNQSDYANGVAGTNIHTFFFPSVGGTQWRSPRYSLSAGAYHVVGASSSANATLYVNGVSRSTDTATSSGNFSNTSKTCNIARSNGGSGYYGNTIYMIRVYSRTLSEAEIIQNFNATRGRYSL